MFVKRYIGLFLGRGGNTYGCHLILQMLAPGHDVAGLASHNWFEVLVLAGALNLVNARCLMESHPFTSSIPDQSLIITDYFPETDYVVATQGEGYVMVYFPTG